MMHYKEELKDYVLLMLGSPVIVVDLSDEELTFCIEKPVELCQQNGLPDIINIPFWAIQILTRMVQEGAVALGRYIIAKKKFNRWLYQSHYNLKEHGMAPSYLMTPQEDGFADMIQADSDWYEFVNKVSCFGRALRKPINERDTASASQTD